VMKEIVAFLYRIVMPRFREEITVHLIIVNNIVAVVINRSIDSTNVMMGYSN